MLYIKVEIKVKYGMIVINKIIYYDFIVKVWEEFFFLFFK